MGVARRSEAKPSIGALRAASIALGVRERLLKKRNFLAVEFTYFFVIAIMQLGPLREGEYASVEIDGERGPLDSRVLPQLTGPPQLAFAV